MIGLLQRVSEASVVVDGAVVGEIGGGVLVLIGIERDDTRVQADRLCERILGYRVFPDQQGHLNVSVGAMQGGVLLVPQFTLAADTRKGMRASFTSAAVPELARRLFEYLLECIRAQHATVASGVFGADMKVHLVNDGPVTFWLQTRAQASSSS